MVETIIQLKHPEGKKGIRMEKRKYDPLKNLLLNHLETKGESSYSEIFRGITENFEKNNQKFEGSLGWHLEWVKLDLEARGVIKRLGKQSPLKYAMVK